MIVVRLIIVIFFLLLLFQSITAQDNSNFAAPKLFEPDKLREDFDELVGIMKQHPARTLFTSEQEWQQIVNKQKALLTSPMTAAQFFDVCAQVIHRIRCGHTGLDLPENFLKKSNQAVFPLSIEIVNDSLIVTESMNSEVVKGSTILEINGKPFNEILPRIKTYVSADGMNTTWIIRRLNQSLGNFLSLYFNFTYRYEITYQKPQEGTIDKATFNAVRFADLSAKIPKNDPLTYNVLKSAHTAVMGIHSFNYYRKDSLKFFRTISAFFDQVHSDNIQNLIIDLRGNSGGDPFCAAHLLSYLDSKPFIYYNREYNWCPNLSKPYSTKSKRFSGRLYVLIDGLCFSTTGHLLSLMKMNNIGVLIGEEAGGTYTCNDSGKWFELKNSKLKLRMARESFRTTAGNLPHEKGVMPDHEVIASSTDVLQGKDVVLGYALEVIDDK